MDSFDSQQDKEADGTDPTLSEEVLTGLETLSAEQFAALTVLQIREVLKLIESNMARCNDERLQAETDRSEALKEIGNMLHESVPVSNDEVCIITVSFT